MSLHQMEPTFPNGHSAHSLCLRILRKRVVAVVFLKNQDLHLPQLSDTNTPPSRVQTVLWMLSFLDLEFFSPSPPPIADGTSHHIAEHVTIMLPGLIFAGLLFIIALLFSNPKLASWVRRRQTPRPEGREGTDSTDRKESSDGMSTSGVGSRSSSRKEIDMMFATFDKDDDGVITAKELFESLRSMGVPSTDKEAESLVRSVDSNGDGVVDMEEFREIYNSSIVSARRPESKHAWKTEEEEEEEEEKDMKKAFDVFDENHDGQISVEELRVVLKSIGARQGYSEADCLDMIRKVDLDGDGKVSYEEFQQMMKTRDGEIF